MIKLVQILNEIRIFNFNQAIILWKQIYDHVSKNENFELTNEIVTKYPQKPSTIDYDFTGRYYYNNGLEDPNKKIEFYQDLLKLKDRFKLNEIRVIYKNTRLKLYKVPRSNDKYEILDNEGKFLCRISRHNNHSSLMMPFNVGSPRYKTITNYIYKKGIPYNEFSTIPGKINFRIDNKWIDFIDNINEIKILRHQNIPSNNEIFVKSNTWNEYHISNNKLVEFLQKNGFNNVTEPIVDDFKNGLNHRYHILGHVEKIAPNFRNTKLTDPNFKMPTYEQMDAINQITLALFSSYWDEVNTHRGLAEIKLTSQHQLRNKGYEYYPELNQWIKWNQSYSNDLGILEPSDVDLMTGTNPQGDTFSAWYNKTTKTIYDIEKD